MRRLLSFSSKADGPQSGSFPDAVSPRKLSLATPYELLPVATNLCWEKSHKELKYVFGDSEEEPRYLSLLYTGWNGSRTRWALYDGENSETCHKLATADKAGDKRQHTVVTVYGLCGSEFNTMPVVEEMTSHHELGGETRFAFSFRVASGERQEFEWRQSRQNDGRGPDDWGWKLVRADDLVVAFWADSNRQRTNRIAAFVFYGAGATGELGENWSIMVAMTALRLFDITHDPSFSSPIGGKGGASLAAAGIGGG